VFHLCPTDVEALASSRREFQNGYLYAFHVSQRNYPSPAVVEIATVLLEMLKPFATLAGMGWGPLAAGAVL